MKIAFVSVRGIPNDYGGFEQFAEHVSVGLARRGHEVVVYSPHSHPFKGDSYKGVRVRHVYCPERWLGRSAGSAFYDFLSLRDALKREIPDIVYVAGYMSVVPAYLWFNVRRVGRPLVVTNMDGLEYRRTRFNRLARKFLAWEERMAALHSHYLVADNTGLQDYYREKYGRGSKYLAYGADVHGDHDPSVPGEFGLEAGDYYLAVARLEPENNLPMAIEGYLSSSQRGRRPLAIVGKTDTPHGRRLTRRYGGCPDVRFLGGIYDFRRLDSLRRFCLAYFHGHSVGGTNPSLLEAMAAGCFVLAHDNAFNRSVLGDNALYYGSADAARALLDGMDVVPASRRAECVARNLEAVRRDYSWEKIVDEHEEYFKWMLARPRRGGLPPRAGKAGRFKL